MSVVDFDRRVHCTLRELFESPTRFNRVDVFCPLLQDEELCNKLPGRPGDNRC
jgi:hypothetical protein